MVWSGIKPVSLQYVVHTVPSKPLGHTTKAVLTLEVELGPQQALGAFDFMQRRRCRQPAAVGCLEAENAIGCFKSAGLQAAAGDIGAA